MDREEQELRAALEPLANAVAHYPGKTAALLSIAVSLKRIADRLDSVTVETAKPGDRFVDVRDPTRS